jgi:hypothetical protein
VRDWGFKDDGSLDLLGEIEAARSRWRHPASAVDRPGTATKTNRDRYPDGPLRCLADICAAEQLGWADSHLMTSVQFCSTSLELENDTATQTHGNFRTRYGQSCCLRTPLTVRVVPGGACMQSSVQRVSCRVTAMWVLRAREAHESVIRATGNKA